MTKEEIIALCKAGDLPYKKWRTEGGGYFVQIDGWNALISADGEDAAWSRAWELRAWELRAWEIRAKSSQSWQDRWAVHKDAMAVHIDAIYKSGE